MWILLINIIPAFLSALIFQLFFHEIGHMIGGLLTGWKYLYLQIYHLAFVRHGHFIRLLKIQTTNNQCIMYPRSIKTGVFLYTLGGCLLNFLLTAVSLVIMIVWHDKALIWLYAWCFFVLGIGFYLMNGLPSSKRICNDMACYQILKTDKNARLSHNAQLMIAKHLFNGESYNEISEELICLTPEQAGDDILAYQATLEAYYQLDIGNRKLAVQALGKINMEASISKCISDIIHMELLYLDLVAWFDKRIQKAIVSDRYSEGMKAYLEQYETRGDIHSVRIKTVYDAYAVYLEGNKEKAKQILGDTMKHMESMSCIYEGERKFCIRQLQSVRAKL